MQTIYMVCVFLCYNINSINDLYGVKKMKRKLAVKVLIVLFIVLLVVIGCLFFLSNRKIDIGFKVKDSYVIENIDFKDDYNFYLEGYNWYKEMENDKDVYILNTAYYDTEVLDIWKGVYENVPKKPFWYYAVSPSYLKTMNIDVDDEAIEDANKGVRVYLIPDTYTEEEKELMTNYLKEDSERALGEKAARKPEDAIKTKYYENKKIEFKTYTPTEEYFTYPSEQDVPLTEKYPIIFICTSNNMIYFESESLFATDVNSYIKFANEDTVKKYEDADFVKKYNAHFTKLSEIYKKAQSTNVIDKGLFSVFED